MIQSNALEVLKEGHNVFLTGEAGSGKSHTICEFVKWMKKEGITYAITATTGIAASHINGSTIHSWAGLGIKRRLTKEQVAGIKRNQWVAKKIKATDVLIIDEISMMDAVALEDVDAVLRAIRSKLEPFGGLQVVFVGDFFQLPPVVREPEERLFAFESGSWELAMPEVCYLTEQHRQDDPVFLEVLTAMRHGTITDQHKEILAKCALTAKPVTQLYTHNADVDRVNAMELAKIDEKEHSFTMKTSGIDFLVATLKRGCLSPEKLVLKKGATVMFTRNNFDEGYVNGSIGVVTEFMKNGLPKIKLQNGQTVMPDKAEWKFEEDGHVKAWIKQIPLRLAWAVTVHKSQGMSLDSAKMDLSKVFEFGQGYVAISRVKSLAGLHIRGLNDNVYMMHPKVIAADKLFRKADGVASKLL